MRAQFKNAFSRRNATGVMVDRFSYIIKFDNEAEKAKYITARGQYHREDENGDAIWTSTSFVGIAAELKFTFDGTGFYADNTETKTMQSLANQFGGQLGAAMADKISTILIAKYTGRATTQATPVVQAPPVVTIEPPIEPVLEPVTQSTPEVLDINAE